MGERPYHPIQGDKPLPRREYVRYDGHPGKRDHPDHPGHRMSRGELRDWLTEMERAGKFDREVADFLFAVLGGFETVR